MQRQKLQAIKWSGSWHILYIFTSDVQFKKNKLQLNLILA